MDIPRFPNPVSVRVLVVDDHPTTASTLARAIARIGPEIEALSANSGEQALELAQTWIPDILITDMMMPGINGLELIDELQSRTRHQQLYSIVITAYNITEIKLASQRLNIGAIIVKPIKPERICQLVANAIKTLSVKLPETKPAPRIRIADEFADSIPNHEEM